MGSALFLCSILNWIEYWIEAQKPSLFPYNSVLEQSTKCQFDIALLRHIDIVCIVFPIFITGDSFVSSCSLWTTEMYVLLKKAPIAHISQGLYSLSGKTSYHKISWRLKAARFGVKLFLSLWILTGTRQQCCRDACQSSERYDHYNIQSVDFETSRDLAVGRFTT